jgi:Ca2+-binding RTX toxin-like protein
MKQFELIADYITNDDAAFINADGTKTLFSDFVPKDANGDSYDPKVGINYSSDRNILLTSGDLSNDGADDIIFASPYGTVTACHKDSNDLSVEMQGQSLVGDEGNNILTGTNGSDTINGGGGDDKLISGKGDDLIEGGSGNDIIDGGSGIDTIILGSNGTFGSNLKAHNISSNIQIGTEELINLTAKQNSQTL